MRKIAFFGLLVGLAAGCPGPDDDDASGSNPTQASAPDTTETTDTADTTDTQGAVCPYDQPGDTTDGASDPIQQTWGAPCSDDADCVALIGEGAECLASAAELYELPEGYCSKPCELPDTSTRFVHDDPQCDPNGGVSCIGQRPIFEYCGVPCSDDAQCNRDGYYCRQMPVISQAGDPTFCLMPDCCENGC